MMKYFLPLAFVVLCVPAPTAVAQYVPAQLPLVELPREHAYQKTLRKFMATLEAKDFEVEHKQIVASTTADADELFRLWILSLHVPDVSAARLPAGSFTLGAIEGKKGLTLPCAPLQCQMLAWLARWDDGGNPYRGSRALKLRAFMLAAVEIMMLDYLYEHDPQGANRADFLGGNLIWLGSTYQGIKDALPAEALAGFEAGLKKLVLTLDKWGPRGAMTDMDLFAPVGLRYISEGMKDAEITKVAERYSRRLFTDPRFFHPAGYFVDSGCFDTSYNGISLYFSTWAALMSDWKFARDAVAKAYRLRAHLSFPHPDGSFSGPSAMASRCSGDPPRDQWQFFPRIHGGGMVTPEAYHLAALPSADALKAAPQAVAARLNSQLDKPQPASGQPWREGHWSNALNFAYDFYPKGYYEKRLSLAKEDSPLLKPLYARGEARGEQFVREFDKAFVIARLGGYAAAVHTGPVGGIHQEWQRPYGFGGGQLSAFWTSETGPVILGRRRGVQGPVFDSFAEWRTWPVHAVSGVTADGHLLTSTRIQTPDVKTDCGDKKADVRVEGVIPKYIAARKETVASDVRYQRRFFMDSDGVRIQTTLQSGGKEKLAELYETIPIFLTETANQKPPTIRFHVGNDWLDATAEPKTKVKAVKIKRFTGEVMITFTRPATVKLSPEVWKDGFQTQALCRTLLVDLLDSGAGAVRHVSVEYTITPVGKAQASKR